MAFGRNGGARIVSGISLQVDHGEVPRIVGEFGSGKSVGMLAALGLQIKGACVTGSVRFMGREILDHLGTTCATCAVLADRGLQ